MFNESDAVGLQLGLTLQQIIDVVIITRQTIPLPSAIDTFSSMNTFITYLHFASTSAARMVET